MVKSVKYNINKSQEEEEKIQEKKITGILLLSSTEI